MIGIGRVRGSGATTARASTNMGDEVLVSRALGSEGVHIVGSEVRSDAAVHACDFAPTGESERDLAGGAAGGRSVAMSFGAVSLDDEYVSSLPSPGSSEAGEESPEDLLRICVVGSGTRFISGISYYTYYLSDALQETFNVSAVLMRRLLPRRFYPGRRRVGAHITDIETRPSFPPSMASIGLPYPAYFGRGDFYSNSSPTWSSFSGGRGPCCTRSCISSGWPDAPARVWSWNSTRIRIPARPACLLWSASSALGCAISYGRQITTSSTRNGTRTVSAKSSHSILPGSRSFRMARTRSMRRVDRARPTKPPSPPAQHGARCGRGGHHTLLRDDSSLQGSGRSRRGFQPPAPRRVDSLAPSGRRGDVGGMGASRREDPGERIRQ